MDKQVSTLLGVVAVSIVLLYLARPKNSNINTITKKPSLEPPRTISNEANDKKKDGAIAIEAMRSAINADEPQDRIDELQAELKKDLGMKVLFDDDGKLKATTLEGKLITKEK